MASPVIGQAGCPGREPDCLKPARTWVGVSARTYNDSNSIGDRVKEGRGSEGRHTGTGEGICARIHVANSHVNRAEDGRRSDCRHSADDDDCFYYHSWRNNVVIAFGTLSSFIIVGEG